MPRFEFRADPAWVTVTDGLSLAFRHWRATVTYWAIPVLVIGIISTIAFWGLEAAIAGSLPPSSELYDPYTGEIDLVALFTPVLPGFIVSTVILGILTLITRWIYYALAISGLRGRELSASLILGRGIRAFAADLLFMVAYLAIIGVLLGIARGPGTGIAIMLGIGAFCVSLFLGVRLAFWALMIFDGAGILEAASASWQASRGAVGRMVGWALAVGAVGFVVNIGVSVATFPLSDAVPLSSGVKAGATEAFAVFQLFTLAVLYESQLRRTMPHRASPPPAATVEPLRAWPGYAPAEGGGTAPGGMPAGQAPWPPAPVPGSAPEPGSAPASGAWASWDVPPINPDAPDSWGAEPAERPEPAADTTPADHGAPPAAPQPPPPPA